MDIAPRLSGFLRKSSASLPLLLRWPCITLIFVSAIQATFITTPEVTRFNNQVSKLGSVFCASWL